MSVHEFRPKEKATAKPKPQGGTYECSKCKNWNFLLSELGTVWCANCGALTKNLMVIPTKEPNDVF